MEELDKELERTIQADVRSELILGKIDLSRTAPGLFPDADPARPRDQYLRK